MEHCGINILWPTTHPKPTCTLCPNNDTDTWPHLLFTCENQTHKGPQNLKTQGKYTLLPNNASHQIYPIVYISYCGYPQNKPPVGHNIVRIKFI